MDPYVHTAIAVFCLAASFYISKILSARAELKRVPLYEQDGAMSLLDMLEEEGTYKRQEILDSVSRWVDLKTEGKI
jgi:hypothetical protein